MFLTICQACHKGKKLSANNKTKYYRFIYYVDFQFVVLGNIAHYVTDEDYEAGENLGIKPDIDDFTPIQHRKKSDHNRKTFSSYSRHNPLFYRQLSLLILSQNQSLKDCLPGLITLKI